MIQVDERLGDAPLAIGILLLFVHAIERVQRGLVARIVAEPSLELDRVVVGNVLRRDTREIDLDRHVGAGFLELLLEIEDALLEVGHATLKREAALIRCWLDRLKGSAWALLVFRSLVELLDDDLMPRLVRGLERQLERPQASFVEAELLGHSVELLPLFLRDDAVLDDLGEELLVHHLELAEPHVGGDLTRLERHAMVEFLLRHGPSVIDRALARSMTLAGKAAQLPFPTQQVAELAIVHAPVTIAHYDRN